MNKKYFSFFSLAVSVLLLGGLLSGCGLETADKREGTVEEMPAGVVSELSVQPAPVEPQVSAITDAELDQEIKDLDADLETVKTTGFEASNLADKDLGL